MRIGLLVILLVSLGVSAGESGEDFPSELREAKASVGAALVAFLRNSDAEALVHRNQDVRDGIEQLREEVDDWTSLAERYAQDLQDASEPPEPVGPALVRLERTAAGGEIIERFLDQFDQMAVVVAETEPLYAGTLLFSNQEDADRYNAIATAVQETQRELLAIVAELQLDR